MSTEDRQKKITDILNKLNLSSKEIEVLLALLKNGRSSASDISYLIMNITRTSIYDQLYSLEKKGFISTVIEKRKKLYQPENLEHIVESLEQDKREIEQKQKALRSVSDIYEQMKSGTAYRPSVRTFKGKNGILAVHRELQDARKKLYAIGDLAAVMRIFPDVQIEDNLKDFQTYKILRKSLMVHNTSGEKYLKVAPQTNFHKIRWLPKGTTVNTDTLIWDGHVAIIDYIEPINAVVIDNPTIYDTFNDWFELIWKSSEDIN